MKILNAILALLLVMLSGSVFAQPLTSIPFQAHIEKAEEYAETNNLASQLDQLEEAYKKNRDKSMLPLMAELNYKLRDYGKAENLYKRIVDSDKKGTNIEALYMYGKMLKLNGKYAEAAEVFRKIKDGDNDTYANLSILELKGILLAVSSDSTNVTVSSAGPKVNTKSGEYSPFLMENELYFTSSALESGAEPGKDYGVKLLRSQKDKDGGWGKSTEADALILSACCGSGTLNF